MRRTKAYAAVAAVFVVAVIAAGCSTPSQTTATPSQGATGWPLPADASAAAAKAGLPMLGEEKLAVHYHAHLDVIVRGVTIPVPADIGIDEQRHRISPLHTHDGTGLVHIESAVDISFTVGQLFTEWGQPLSTGRVGPETAASGEQVRLYRNGTQVTGDPAAVVVGAHDEIVVWLGPAGEQPQVPASYNFPQGT